jgi:dATP pyrophosphohydrolase
VKLPISVLVVVYTAGLEVLLMERATRRGYWQSVTGSLDWKSEPLADAALREVREETGIEPPRSSLDRWNVTYTFEIYGHWRHRFAPGVTHNVEHVFAIALPAACAVALAPEEHTSFQWLPWREAAAKCFSWSNRDAIRMLPERAARAQQVRH